MGEPEITAPATVPAAPPQWDYRGILDALGGPREAAALLAGVAPKARYNGKAARAWYYRNSIPSDALAHLAGIFEERGKNIHDYLTKDTA